MNKVNNNILPYLTFKIDNRQLAISTSYVNGIIESSKWIKVPNMPEFIRGTINFRGNMIYLIDLRTCMGVKSLMAQTNEIIELLNARENDHKKWLTELENSVKENREFGLARDPHKCAFGKWYYSFETNNLSLRNLLYKFEAPHNKIHSIADIVHAHVEKGEFQIAREIIDKTRANELHQMIDLFEKARNQYYKSFQEMIIIVESEGRTIGLFVDSTESIEEFDESTIEDLSPQMFGSDTSLTSKIIKRKDDDNLILVLDIEKVFALKM